MIIPSSNPPPPPPPYRELHDDDDDDEVEVATPADDNGPVWYSRFACGVGCQTGFATVSQSVTTSSAKFRKNDEGKKGRVTHQHALRDRLIHPRRLRAARRRRRNLKRLLLLWRQKVVMMRPRPRPRSRRPGRGRSNREITEYPSSTPSSCTIRRRNSSSS